MPKTSKNDVSGEPSQGPSIAVAIADNQADGKAPRVVAKGQGKLADQILEIAFARGVKVRTDQNLAQVLAAIEIESEVPLQALAAVAEILTYVYRVNGGDMPGPQGEAVSDGAGAEP